jgi:hypothetical protein
MCCRALRGAAPQRGEAVKAKGWIVCTSDDGETIATLRDVAWAYISRTANEANLVVNSCVGERPHVPLEVVEELLKADRNRSVP